MPLVTLLILVLSLAARGNSAARDWGRRPCAGRLRLLDRYRELAQGAPTEVLHGLGDLVQRVRPHDRNPEPALDHGAGSLRRSVVGSADTGVASAVPLVNPDTSSANSFGV